MKVASGTLSLLCLALAASARAGDVPAGPAAAAAPGVGSIVTPGAHELLGTPSKDDRRNRILPGDGAALVLAADQLAATAAVLGGFNGATTEGNTVRAPTVLADGTPAIIVLDKESGRLLITRRVR